MFEDDGGFGNNWILGWSKDVGIFFLYLGIIFCLFYKVFKIRIKVELWVCGFVGVG